MYSSQMCVSDAAFLSLWNCSRSTEWQHITIWQFFWCVKTTSMEVIVLKFPSSGREDKTWGVYISKLVYLHRLLFWHRTTRYYVWSLSLSNNPFTSKVSRELANLIERKNTHPNLYCVKYLFFCLSVTNFDLNYWASLIGSIFSSG